MTSHRRPHGPARRAHLRLVTATSPPPAPPEERRAPATALLEVELQAMSELGALIRQRAAELPEDSSLRAELLETAEYYSTGAEQHCVDA